MANNERILLSSPHMSGNEMKYINEAFETNWIAPLGANVDGFEKELAEYAEIHSVAAVSSGTAAIHLALKLLNVEPNDYIFCSTFTFVASANPVLYEHATPIFIDSEPRTWNMSPIALEKAFKYCMSINKMPKAVIVVHLYGQSADMDEILSICNKYNVPIIEDAAESLGTLYKNQKSGTHGLFGVYSFNGNKIITTSGGGALISNDKELIERARFLSTQSKEAALHYEHKVVGYNYRMSNISAGIGRGQLEVLNERVKARRENFDFYVNELSSIEGIEFLKEREDDYSNYWLTAITINKKIIDDSIEKIIKKLNDDNIEVRRLWKPLHTQQLFSESLYFNHFENDNVSEQLFEIGMCLPSGSNLDKNDLKKVCSSIKEILSTSLKKEGV